jgi:hypothetical protein
MIHYRHHIGLLCAIVWLMAFTAYCYDTEFDMTRMGPKTESINLQDYKHIIYISVTKGSDKSGHGSREKPWKTLVFALTQVEDASEMNSYALLVSEGTYSHGTVNMREYVDLYGGYSSENWDRDIFAHPSILDGQRVRRVVVGAHHSRIDGFVITNGVSRSHGAGILCWDASPLVSNNVFTNNLVLEPENFDHLHIHQDGHHGGGIAVLYNSIPIIRNNLLYGNKTSVGCGGGMAFYGLLRMEGVPEAEVKENRRVGGVQAVVEHNVIMRNISGINDLYRTRSSSGGGVYCAYEANPIIRRNIIQQNRAMGKSDAGGLYCEYFSDPLIECNWIVGNYCDDDGGGIYTMRLGQPLIRGNIFAGNWTIGGGVGGIRLSKEGRAEIIDNLIVHNPGGGVMCLDSQMKLEGNTIMHNEDESGVIYLMRFSYFLPTIIQNNIIRENHKGAISIREDHGQPLIIKNNNMQGNEFIKGNYDKDPGFIEDGISGKYLSVDFDSSYFVSSLKLENDIEINFPFAGRVIRIDDQWGVIKEVKGDHIIVWGEFDPGSGAKNEFEILPSYRKK